MDRNELKDLYVKLLNDTKKYNTKKDIKLTAAMYLVGEEYINSKNKLLVIGRAPNGWNEKYSWLSSESINVIDKTNTIINIWNEYDNGMENYRFSEKDPNCRLSFEDARRLEWVHSFDRKNKDQTDNFTKNDIKGRKTESFPFWSTTKRWAIELNTNDDSWSKKIAWTNLYKVSPANGGNPDKNLCALQLETCKNILAKEIEMLKPTHIIVIAMKNHRTEMNDAIPSDDIWTKDFYDILETAKKTRHKSCIYLQT